MSEPVQDKPTVTPEGKSIAKLPEGISFRESETHVDERGTLCEIFDPRWGWSPHPLTNIYMVTIRPGVIKGWALHKLHEDRYFVVSGEMEVVLYDARPESSTYGLVSVVPLSWYNRRMMNIPAGIWHADRNIGSQDVMLINCPTRAYDYENPDKYRLPLDTDQIPYKFENPRGW